MKPKDMAAFVPEALGPVKDPHWPSEEDARMMVHKDVYKNSDYPDYQPDARVKIRVTVEKKWNEGANWPYEYVLTNHVYMRGSREIMRSRQKRATSMSSRAISRGHWSDRSGTWSQPLYTIPLLIAERYMRRLYKKIAAAGFPEQLTIAAPHLRKSASSSSYLHNYLAELHDAVAYVVKTRESYMADASERQLTRYVEAYNCSLYEDHTLRSDLGFKREYVEPTPLLNYLVLNDGVGWRLFKNIEAMQERIATARALLHSKNEFEAIHERLAKARKAA